MFLQKEEKAHIFVNPMDSRCTKSWVLISLLKSNFYSEDFNTMLLLDVVNYGSFFTDSFSLSVNCHNFLGKLVEWFSTFSTVLISAFLLDWLPPKAKITLVYLAIYHILRKMDLQPKDICVKVNSI